MMGSNPFALGVGEAALSGTGQFWSHVINGLSRQVAWSLPNWCMNTTTGAFGFQDG